MNTPQPHDDDWPALWSRRHAVLHRAYVTYRYHRRRERFFDLVDKASNAVTVLLAASLLGQTLQDLSPVVASVISALGLMNLVFGYGDRKQAHKALAEQAMALVGRIESAPMDQIDDIMAGGWEAAMAQLNAKEPPQLKTLVVLCEREQAEAIGNVGHVPLPPWWRRVLADFKS